MQSLWFCQVVQQINDNGVSYTLGRFDQYMYPYYAADIENGVLTKQQAQEYLNGVIQSVEEEKTKPTPKKRKQAEEEIRVLRAENAALRQAKDISDHDRADLFELYQESERANKSKESVYKMVSDILSAYPDEFRTLLHKSREKKTTPYYKENSHGYDRGGK